MCDREPPDDPSEGGEVLDGYPDPNGVRERQLIENDEVLRENSPISSDHHASFSRHRLDGTKEKNADLMTVIMAYQQQVIQQVQEHLDSYIEKAETYETILHRNNSLERKNKEAERNLSELDEQVRVESEMKFKLYQELIKTRENLMIEQECHQNIRYHHYQYKREIESKIFSANIEQLITIRCAEYQYEINVLASEFISQYL